jgi:BirA family biotin operon repressor/biotin-[acetyl-CoA-carboxylase] ligase
MIALLLIYFVRFTPKNKFSLFGLMETLFVGKNLIFLPQTDSTNSYAMELLKNVKVLEGTVVQAAHQTAGRGQRGSVWNADPASNLTLSIIFHPSFLKAEETFFLYIISALACYDTTAHLLSESHFDIRIKWPNDIFVNRMKTCGILIENKWNAERLANSVIGIGMNVNQSQFEGLNASALGVLAGKHLSLDRVKDRLFQDLEKYYLMLRQGERKSLKQLYCSRMLGLNDTMHFMYKGQRHLFRILGLSDSGLLQLQKENEILELDLGQIQWLL